MFKRRRFVCLCPLLTVGLLSAGAVSLVSPCSRVWADEQRTQVGDKVEAIDINGKWTNATVVKVDGQRRFVHFEGKTDYWDDWVGPDRFRAPGAASNAPAQPAGEAVEALDFNKKWTNATVLKVDGQKKFVHFEGKSDYWDEWVGPERIRAFGTTNASALQHLAPDQPGTKGVNGWIVGTRIANGAYACTFYWFQPNGHLFMSDRMPKGWADLEFSALQKADASHCGTYGIKGDRITIQMNGEAPVALGYSDSLIGGNVRQPAWTFQPGQRLDGGFSIDTTSNFAGVTAVASDSWYFRADGTFERVKVAGAMTNDTKGPHDPHPAKATAGGSDVTEGRYDFVKGRLELTGANGQNQTLSCFAIGSKTNPNMLGIEDAQYKANVDNKDIKK